MKLRYPFISLNNDRLFDDVPASEISMKSRKIKNSIHLETQEAGYTVREAGQLRRAKMRMSYSVDNLDIKNKMPSALRELLEASLILQTTSTRILAGYLKRSPATIRAEFLRIIAILGSTAHISMFESQAKLNSK